MTGNEEAKRLLHIVDGSRMTYRRSSREGRTFSFSPLENRRSMGRGLRFVMVGVAIVAMWTGQTLGPK